MEGERGGEVNRETSRDRGIEGNRQGGEEGEGKNGREREREKWLRDIDTSQLHIPEHFYSAAVI